MNMKLMDILCCPVCKGDLKLTVDKKNGLEVIKGKLYCQTCDFSYPIKLGIPNLMPPEYHNDLKPHEDS